MATGGAIKAGEAFIELSLKGARTMGQQLRGAIASMGRLAREAARLGVALSTAFGAASIAGIRSFVREGDRIQKMAQRTGLTAEALSELAFAAEQSGTNIDQLGQALFRATRRIGNAQTQTGPAARALEELGLAASELSELQPDVLFERLVESLAGVENEARRSQLAFEIFGDNWRQLAPLINQGSEGIRNLREQARILGRTISGEQAEKAAALADRWNEVRSVFRGFVFDIVDNFAPALDAMLAQMRNFLLDWKLWVLDLEEAYVQMVNRMTVQNEDLLNTLGGALANALGLNQFGVGNRAGTIERQLTGRRLNEIRRQRRDILSGGRPSANFELSNRAAAASIAGAIEAAQRSGVGGRSFGSFAADARQFGIISVGRKQLRTLERIEQLQREQNERLEATGFFAFL